MTKRASLIDRARGHAADLAAESRDVLTLAQAAELLQVKTETLRYWLIDGVVPGRKIGKFWRLSRVRLVHWCEGANK